MNKHKESMSCAISVITPVYNVAPYLRECLDSIRNQTFADIEVLCVDDGSTDTSGEILDEYGHRDPRIRVFHRKNVGAYRARNAALEHVTGRYVLFLDADDWVEPELCEKAFYRAEQSQADIVIYYWKYASQRFESPEWELYNLHDWNMSTHRSPFPLEFGYLCQKLYRASFLRRHRLIFDERFFSKVDLIFHWQTMSLADKVALLPEVLYHYRVHGTSITATIGKRFLEIVDVMYAIKRNLLEIGDPRGLLPDPWRSLALRFIHSAYLKIPPQYRREMSERIRNSLGEDEREYYRQRGNLPEDTRCFYLSLESPTNHFWYGKAYPLKNRITSAAKKMILPPWLRKKIVSFVRSQSYSLRQSSLDDLKKSAALLEEEVALLCEENYKLRRALNIEATAQEAQSF